MDTREKILHAAELLFAKRGYDGVSMREIASAAGVNLAASNYHFGSKESLYETVFLRRIRPINERRARLLGEIERRIVEGTKVAIGDVLTAYSAPVFEPAREAPDGWIALKLLAQNHHGPPGFMTGLLAREFDPLVKRCLKALRAPCPHLPPTELLWRFLLANGAMLLVAARCDDLADFTHGQCRTDDPDAVLRHIVDFGVGGFAGVSTSEP